MDLIDRKSLIESKHNQLSVSEQCELIGVSRSSFYYNPVPMSQEAIKILHKIDEIATDNSEYGYRLIYEQLKEDGYNIGRNRALKYMGILGIQAIYPTKKESQISNTLSIRYMSIYSSSTGLQTVRKKLYMSQQQMKFGVVISPISALMDDTLATECTTRSTFAVS